MLTERQDLAPEFVHDLTLVFRLAVFQNVLYDVVAILVLDKHLGVLCAKAKQTLTTVTCEQHSQLNSCRCWHSCVNFKRTAATCNHGTQANGQITIRRYRKWDIHFSRAGSILSSALPAVVDGMLIEETTERGRSSMSFSSSRRNNCRWLRCLQQTASMAEDIARTPFFIREKFLIFSNRCFTQFQPASNIFSFSCNHKSFCLLRLLNTVWKWRPALIRKVSRYTNQAIIPITWGHSQNSRGVRRKEIGLHSTKSFRFSHGWKTDIVILRIKNRTSHIKGCVWNRTKDAETNLVQFFQNWRSLLISAMLQDPLHNPTAVGVGRETDNLKTCYSKPIGC